MLSDIRLSWPPVSSQTGTKSSGNTTISLTDLHTGAWWTGVRISGQSPYRVRLHSEEGVAFGYAPDTCEWIQSNGWYPFPWPIPAAMAKAMGLHITITPLDNIPRPIHLVCCFHELPQMNVHDKYLFMDPSGTLVHQWNGRKHVWGTPTSGEEPIWRTVHILVPPMQVLLNHWSDDVFCVHEWSERPNENVNE